MGSLRNTILAGCQVLPVLLSAQMGTAAGTSLRIAPGTTLHIDTPLVWTTAAGSQTINDGLVLFGTGAGLAEAPGAPFIGTGTERTTVVLDTPPITVDPAGLGLGITTSYAPGTTTVERGHSTTVDASEGSSIARWYRVQSAANGPAQLTLRYDPTELNGLDEADLWIYREHPLTSVWTPFASIVAPPVLSATVDSMGHFTAFDADLHVGLNSPDPAVDRPLLWPNPAGPQAQLHIPSGRMVHRIELIGIDGRVHRQWNGAWPGDSVPTLDLTGLAAGTYHIRLDGTGSIPLVIR
ncbi:MAG TPA: hypothetical protein VGE21_05090 [Flavobacteriales bacterium]